MPRFAESLRTSRRSASFSHVDTTGGRNNPARRVQRGSRQNRSQSVRDKQHIGDVNRAVAVHIRLQIGVAGGRSAVIGGDYLQIVCVHDAVAVHVGVYRRRRPEAQRFVAACRHERGTVRRKRDRIYVAGMTLQRRFMPAVSGRIEARRPVLISGGERLTVRAKTRPRTPSLYSRPKHASTFASIHPKSGSSCRSCRWRASVRPAKKRAP